MAQTTPGPWRTEGRWVRAGMAKVIAEVPQGGVHHGAIDRANASLIAAAPDLLAACKVALSEYDRLDAEGYPAPFRPETYSLIKAAIARVAETGGA